MQRARTRRRIGAVPIWDLCPDAEFPKRLLLRGSDEISVRNRVRTSTSQPEMRICIKLETGERRSIQNVETIGNILSWELPVGECLCRYFQQNIDES